MGKERKNMKDVKKFASLTLALVMMLAVMATAFAAGTGSITINGVSEETTYEVYQLLDLESYDTTAGAYSYKVNAAWTKFFETAEALDHVTIDENGYVTWKGAEDDETVASFAKDALAYAKANGITPVKSSENAGEFVITNNAESGKLEGKFSDLPLGYYLVDSSIGALCGLTTTNPDASINAKNGHPTLDKTVQEDSTEQWGDSNTADIGQTVYFRTTINVHAGAENYVLHDKMSKGLTFKGVTKVEHVIPGTGTHDEDPDSYEVVTTGFDEEHDCTFDVVFSEELCEKLETNDKLIVYYEAMLNRDAIVANDGNPNETWLDYGEENSTTHDSTTTKTFGIDIVKTDSQNTMIDGAEFKIYDAATGGNEVAVVELWTSDIDDSVATDSEANKLEGYRRARADEPGVTIVVKNGMVRVVGLDNGTYYLEETKAPDGYNKLTTRQKFIISDANLDATFNDSTFSTGSGVHVVNKTGTMLPETGGIGTTLFYVIGSMLVGAAVVLLVTRKRMSEN